MFGPSLEFSICVQDNGKVSFLSVLKCRPVSVSAVNEEGVYLMRSFQLHLNNFNLLTPNDDYSGRTAPLTSKCCILYIYSTNIGTEYFKHGLYSPFFPLQNAVCFINLTYSVTVLFTFYIQGVLKLKK